MKVLSLFDGISCARVALERAGIPVEQYFASEIDKYAIQISKKNYPDIIQIGDVKIIGTDEKSEKILIAPNTEIDLLIGGSPCQDLSIAKKNRKGLDGERSGLFWEYVRILKQVKPKYFILENVASMPKEAKQIITEALGVEPIMINASLVSAQNRKRLFWTNIPNVTLPEDRGILLKDILEKEVDEKYNVKSADFVSGGIGKKNELHFIGGIRNKDWAKDGKNYSRNFGQGDRVYSPDGKSTTLSALGGGRGAKTGLYKVGNVNPSGKGMNGDVHSEEGKSPTLTTNKGEGQKIAVAQRGRNIVDGKRKDVLGAKTEQRFEFGGEKSNTITMVQKDSYVLDDFRIRKLTPIECERLQGLPDNYTEGVSNTQRYKCCGNAFNVDVVAHILSFIPSKKM